LLTVTRLGTRYDFRNESKMQSVVRLESKKGHDLIQRLLLGLG